MAVAAEAKLTRALALSALLACAVAIATGTAQARAATTVGQVAGLGEETAECDEALNLVQAATPGANSYAIPAPGGVITGWAHRSTKATGYSGGLQVWRPLGAGSYRLVGASPLVEFKGNSLNEFATRIPVQAGDLVGMRGEGSECVVEDPEHFVGVDANGTPPAPGAVRSLPTFTSKTFRINIQATLEPDTDGDGQGDETQDPTVALEVSSKKKQKPNKLTVSATCDQDCSIVTDGEAKVPKSKNGKASAAKKKSFALAESLTELDGGVPTDITLGFDKGKSKRKIKKLLKASKKAAKRSKVKATLSATGIAGQATDEKVKIKLKP